MKLLDVIHIYYFNLLCFTEDSLDQCVGKQCYTRDHPFQDSVCDRYLEVFHWSKTKTKTFVTKIKTKIYLK